eukprot:TRINITY_DN2115_c0_g2_i1.p1 TRINITY_DN2115_c0_g2~~TRINITY_DN2115_c0_g2_i1.p1  ORF type:complete len:932 (-),score=242.71 TRINITY_DN2115_c0_g2_i1:140-2935(-)
MMLKKRRRSQALLRNDRSKKRSRSDVLSASTERVVRPVILGVDTTTTMYQNSPSATPTKKATPSKRTPIKRTPVNKPKHSNLDLGLPITTPISKSVDPEPTPDLVDGYETDESDNDIVEEPTNVAKTKEVLKSPNVGSTTKGDEDESSIDKDTDTMDVPKDGYVSDDDEEEEQEDEVLYVDHHHISNQPGNLTTFQFHSSKVIKLDNKDREVKEVEEEQRKDVVDEDNDDDDEDDDEELGSTSTKTSSSSSSSRIPTTELGESKYLLIFDHKERLAFHGKIQIQVVSGKIEIMGRKLSSVDDSSSSSSSSNSSSSSGSNRQRLWYPLYAPYNKPALVIENIYESTESKASDEINIDDVIDVEGDDDDDDHHYVHVDSPSHPLYSQHKNHIKNRTSIIIKTLEWELFSNDRLFAFPQFTKKKNKNNEYYLPPREKEIQDAIYKPIPKMTDFHVVKNYSDYIQIFQAPPSWTLTTERILHRVHEGIVPKSLICGDKSSGKSTFSRYLTNFLHNFFPRVAYLDCDLGQSEFSPPGTMSLTISHRDQPLFGPPSSHSSQSINHLDHSSTTSVSQSMNTTYYAMMYFYGDVTPQNDRKKYEIFISKLAECYRENHSDIPLVVNTQGWIKGEGLEMLISSINEVKPTDIIQIFTIDDHMVTLDHRRNRSNNNNNNNNHQHHQHHDAKYPLPRHLFSRISIPLVSESIVFPGMKVSDISHPFVHTKQTSNQVKKTCYVHSLPKAYFNQSIIQTTPSDERVLKMLSYFKVDNTSSFGHEITYNVPFSKVNVKFLTSSDISTSQIFYALNATIIGILNDSTPYQSKRTQNSDVDKAPLIRIVENNPITNYAAIPCLGLGIIKSIDIKTNHFTVVTPIPRNLLPKANTFHRSDMELPATLLFKESSVNIPYITADAVTKNAAASVMKNRKFITRQKNVTNN